MEHLVCARDYSQLFRLRDLTSSSQLFLGKYYYFLYFAVYNRARGRES